MTRQWLVFLSAAAMLYSCGDNEKVTRLSKRNNELQEQVRVLKTKIKKMQDSSQRLQFLAAQLEGVKAKIITNHGDIEVGFYPDKAPIHCFNFITRAEGGFYDNTQFHRIMKTFMIQGGDPNSKTDDKSSYGQGGPLTMIPHEFNDTRHEPGILSMARVSDVRMGAGCQFFIMHGSAPHLDRQYTAFGKVTKGMDVVNKIAEVETGPGDLPKQEVRIKTIEVYR